MIQINYTQKRSIIDSGKAIRIAVAARKSDSNGHCVISHDTKFMWIPKSAIIEITGWYVFVKDWFYDISDDMKQLEKLDCGNLPVLQFGKTKKDFS